MPTGLPTILDTPRHAHAGADEPAWVRARLLAWAGAVDVVEVSIEPRPRPGVTVLPFLPLSGLGAVPALTRPWVVLDVQGWERAAVEACDAAGLLEAASGLELDVAVSPPGGDVRSPTLVEMAARLGPSLSLASLRATHVDPATGTTIAARVAFAQPSR